MNIKTIVELSASILIALSAGFFGSIFTTPAIPTWYAALNKPFFSPPNWIFAPMWTALYVLMGISAYLVWQKGIANNYVKVALGIFLAQLILNAFWSIIFFGFHWLFFSFLWIVLMWLLILLTIIKFYPISAIAGLLLIPYILWVSFASILNFSVWFLNR